MILILWEKMQLKDIVGELQTIYNSKLAEDWDNVGLLIGHENSEVNTILLCLDITEEVVDKAIKGKVDLIISHHPFIFSGLKRITSETVHGRKMLKIIENKIAVYSGHTNVDFGINGLNDYVFYKLDLNGKVEIYNEFEYEDYNFIKHRNEHVKGGTVRIKVLDYEMELLDLIKIIKEKLGLDFVRYVGENRKIRKIGLVTGGGSSFMHSVKENIDVFLTGDLRYHEALDTLEEGGILIDIGHYESEYLFAELMELQVSQFFKGKIIKHFGEPVFKLG